MPSRPQHLTKSRFKIGCSCPSKLYFKNRPNEFVDASSENAFLKALADGGFQVGELAKVYRPEGIEVKTKDKSQALAETAELLKRERVTIFEAAFQHKNLFIRVDVLEKNGRELKLIEVKAKSFNSESKKFFRKEPDKDGNVIMANWKTYFYDVAFQTYVARQSLRDYKVTPFLLLVDKAKVASVNGLNQNFIIVSSPEEGAVRVKVKPGITSAQLGAEILEDVAVEVEIVFRLSLHGRSFIEHIDYLSAICAEDRFAPPALGKECKNCEFRVPPEKLRDKKSGFVECMKALGVKEDDAQYRPFAFDIWDFPGAHRVMANGRVFADELYDCDFPKSKNLDLDPGWSHRDRQLLQVEMIRSKKMEARFHRDLADALSSVKYPVHFIDFETTMPAIPFHAGRRPYEQLAFQFSHHIMERDGTVRHLNQYLNLGRGAFPNFEFVRALRKALGEEGSVFRYAKHENDVLRRIHAQLAASTEPDRKGLMDFIDGLTQVGPKKERKCGSRNMIDLLEWVKSYYYHPAMGGANGIKEVLPVVLSHSAFLREKYSKPMYGSAEMPSLNLGPQVWWVEEDGVVLDPYKLLPPVFSDLSQEEIDGFLSKEEEEIREGGSAMMAWARIQFTEMPSAEVERLGKALLRYCELDTLAMVMIFECFREEVKGWKR